MDGKVLEALLAERKYEAAEALARRHLAEYPNDALAHMALGVALFQRRECELAATAFKTAAELRPNAAVLSNLGAALRATGNVVDAAKAYQKALALDPKFAQAMANYANVLADLNRHADAEAMSLRAIAHGAKSSEVYVTLGNALFRLGRLPEAADAFSTALGIGYNGAASRNLASTLSNLGRFDEAARVYRSALAHEPGQAAVHSSLLICLNYHPDVSADEVFAEHRAFERLYAAPYYPEAPVYANARDPERRLRIGYVSPDLCGHVVSMFMLPLIEAHDRSRFDITCYAEVRHADETSKKYQELADWVQTPGLSDEALAARIRADGIDVLVDLAGHSPGNRLQVFARRPAPVQLSYVIGTGTTTGLSVIDGLISDAALIPPGSERYFSEVPARLDRPFVAYRPPDTMPDVGPLPVRSSGFITFGYFGRPIRVNAHVVRVWSALLTAVPGSRLRLDNAPFGDASVRADIEARFRQHGIGPERLDLRFSTPQTRAWAGYNEIDIALDPWPQNAGTTTLESLWMGVPVISIADRPPVGRLGVAILGALGLSEFVASSEADYVAKAAGLASDLDRLEALRGALRGIFKASELYDVRACTAGLESVYRDFWRRWCRTGAG